MSGCPVRDEVFKFGEVVVGVSTDLLGVFVVGAVGIVKGGLGLLTSPVTRFVTWYAILLL
jgi:hypothetical protein